MYVLTTETPSLAPLRTRIADRVNALVWHGPIPNRLRAPLSRVVYRNPPMPPNRVIETLDALAAAGVDASVMGGWGVDALDGKQNRVHRDLDLIVDHRDLDDALAVLREIGFGEWYRCDSEPVGDIEIVGGGVVLRDSCLQVVDLHPARLDDIGSAVTRGTIAGRQVLCVSAKQQIRAHRGYHKRSRRERERTRANLETARRALSVEGQVELSK